MSGSPKVKESNQERTLATIGSRLAEIEHRVGRPLERRMTERVENDKFDRSRALGNANAAVQQKFSDAAKQVEASQTAAGAAPGSGRFNAAIAGNRTDAGTSTGFIQNDVNAQAEDRKVANRSALINYGMGTASEGLQGLADAGRNATQQAINAARQSSQNRAAIAQSVGDAAAIGGYYGMKSFMGPDTRGTGQVTRFNMPGGEFAVTPDNAGVNGPLGPNLRGYDPRRDDVEYSFPG